MYVCRPDVITLSETWLDKDILHEEINIDQYNLERKARNRNGGGTAIFIFKNNYRTKQLKLTTLKLFFTASVLCVLVLLLLVEQCLSSPKQ